MKGVVPQVGNFQRYRLTGGMGIMQQVCLKLSRPAVVWVNPVFENHGQLALFTQFRCCFVFIFAPQLILMSFWAVLGSVFVRKQPIWSLKIRIFTTENGEIQVLDPFWPTFWERLHLQMGGRRVHPWFRVGFCWFSNFPARVESV